MCAHKFSFRHMLSSTINCASAHLQAAVWPIRCKHQQQVTVHAQAHSDSVPIVQSHAMSTPSYTTHTWHGQLANDGHPVIMQISFSGIVLPSLHMWRSYNLLTPMYEVTCMHSTLQMCEVLLLLYYMQTATQIPCRASWQHVAELKVACCPTLVYITECIYCIKRMQITLSFMDSLCILKYTRTLLKSINSTCQLTSATLQAIKYQLCFTKHITILNCLGLHHSLTNSRSVLSYVPKVTSMPPPLREHMQL